MSELAKCERMVMWLAEVEEVVTLLRAADSARQRSRTGYDISEIMNMNEAAWEAGRTLFHLLMVAPDSYEIGQKLSEIRQSRTKVAHIESMVRADHERHTHRHATIAPPAP